MNRLSLLSMFFGVSVANASPIILSSGPVHVTFSTSSGSCCGLSCNGSVPSSAIPIPVSKWNTSNGLVKALSLRYRLEGDGRFVGQVISPGFGGYSQNGTIRSQVAATGASTMFATIGFPDCGAGITPSNPNLLCTWGRQSSSSAEVVIPRGSWAGYLGTGTFSTTLRLPFEWNLAMSGVCATYHHELATDTTVELLVTLCPGDFDRNGTVDFFDYLDFVDAFAGMNSATDVNGDGSIDFFDYLDFVDAFSAGC